jgi:hypothetical protein
MLGLPENVRSTLRTLGAFKDAAGQTSRATAPPRAVATPPDIQLFNHPLTIAIHDAARVRSRRA